MDKGFVKFALIFKQPSSLIILLFDSSLSAENPLIVTWYVFCVRTVPVLFPQVNDVKIFFCSSDN